MGFKNKFHLGPPLIVIVVALFYTLYQLITIQPQQLSMDPHYTLDAASYLQGAKLMIERGDFLYTQDLYHSPGAQVITSWIIRLSGSSSPLTFRIFNYAGFILLIFLTFSILKQHFSSSWSLWVVALIAISPFWRLYLGTIQYELWLCLIFTSTFHLLTSPQWETSKLKILVISLYLGLCFLIRYHFIVLLPLVILLTKDTKQKIGLGIFSLIFILSAVICYGQHGVSLGLIGEQSSAQLRWLTTASQGYNYPYPDPLPLAGWHYIIEHPFHYMIQLLRRFLYLFGILSDGYPNPTLLQLIVFPLVKGDWRVVSNLVGTLLMFAGFFHSYKRYPHLLKVYGGLSLVIYLPIFIVGATQRFLLPLYGIHYLFIIFGVLEFKLYCQKFRQSLK